MDSSPPAWRSYAVDARLTAAGQGSDATAVDAALQSGCGALVALQFSLSSMTGLPDDYQVAANALMAAIESATSAVADLQELSIGTARSCLAHGFVTRRFGQQPA